MKIDAKIRWVIDDNQLGIKCDSTEVVPIDMDYTEADKNSIAESIEYELQSKYGTTFIASFSENDGHDFVIENIDELIEELELDELDDMTQYD